MYAKQEHGVAMSILNSAASRMSRLYDVHGRELKHPPGIIPKIQAEIDRARVSLDQAEAALAGPAPASQV